MRCPHRRSLSATLLPVAVATVVAIGTVAVAAPPAAAQVEVRLKLPQRARLDLAGRETMTVAPFLVVAQEGETPSRMRSIDVEKEFERYLLKVLRRETEFKIIESGPIEYPTFDLEVLFSASEERFWREIGRRTQADVIVTGSLDFDIQDRTGYRTQEFVSPLDGRTYYRQVLVEQTGFEYDILLAVIDGKTGELLYRDNFKDFQSFQSDEADPVAGMFENLYALEDRILGVFAEKEIEALRILYRDLS